MFSDGSYTGVNLHSVEPDPPKDKGIRLQTDALKVKHQRNQACEVAEADMQTLEPEELAGEKPDVDDATIMAFLAVVLPEMEKELGVAPSSAFAFDGYEPMWDDMDDDVVKTREVFLEGQAGEQVTDVAWNVTGSVLAISYGKLGTEGWCETNSNVCLWNVFRSGFEAGKPDLTIEVPGFCLCLAFHPKKPAILAGGTYSGELILWDTANELEPQLASSSIDEYFHREGIQAIDWIPTDFYGGGEPQYLITTVSGDGKVLIWDPKGDDLNYPARGFMLLGSKKRIIGGRALSFSPLDQSLFVVGSETGAIMRAFRPPSAPGVTKPTGAYTWKPCAISVLDQLSSNTARMSLQHHVETYARAAGIKEISAEAVFASKPDPATLFPAPKTTDLEPHASCVVQVAFSPFHRKLLLTASADGSVRLFDVLQQRPRYTFFPPAQNLSTCAVSAIAWSSARPCVFAVAMEMGGVYIYDLLESEQDPVLKLPLEQGGSARATRITFNPIQRGLIAVGDDAGRTRVFRLPFRLCTQQKGELTQVACLMTNGNFK